MNIEMIKVYLIDEAENMRALAERFNPDGARLSDEDKELVRIGTLSLLRDMTRELEMAHILGREYDTTELVKLNEFIKQL